VLEEIWLPYGSRLGLDWTGAEGRAGMARQGKARQGKARQGKARQGKARSKDIHTYAWETT
jgi:hypothetical protein